MRISDLSSDVCSSDLPAQPFEALGRGDGPLAVFTGQMDYRPNIDAVRWFAADILPQVRGRHPQASLAIVGRAPTDERKSGWAGKRLAISVGTGCIRILNKQN